MANISSSSQIKIITSPHPPYLTHLNPGTLFQRFSAIPLHRWNKNSTGQICLAHDRSGNQRLCSSNKDVELLAMPYEKFIRQSVSCTCSVCGVEHTDPPHVGWAAPLHWTDDLANDPASLLLPRQQDKTHFLAALLTAGFVAHRLQSAGGYARSSRLASDQNPSQQIVFYPAVWGVTEDLCIIRGRDFFVYGVVEIPVHDYKHEFGWGVLAGAASHRKGKMQLPRVAAAHGLLVHACDLEFDEFAIETVQVSPP